MRETLIGCLPYMPRLETEPATQAYVLTRNRTCDPLVYGMMLQLTQPHQPGLFLLFFMCQVPVGTLDMYQGGQHTGRLASSLHLISQCSLSNCLNWETHSFIYSSHTHTVSFCTGILLGNESGKINNTKYQHLRKSNHFYLGRC